MEKKEFIPAIIEIVDLSGENIIATSFSETEITTDCTDDKGY